MDKYIKDVYKALKCGKEEKKRIINDLRSDMMVALENGETFEDIKQRLGSPVEFAKEFNENLGVVKKSNKKLIIGIVCGLALTVLCFVGYQYLTTPKAISIEESKIFDAKEVFDSSKQVIGCLDNRDYPGLESMFSNILKKSTNQEEMFGAIEKLGEMGAFKKVGEHEFVEYKDKNGISAVGDIIVEYEKRTVVYRLSFNEDMKLIGLYMR